MTRQSRASDSRSAPGDIMNATGSEAVVEALPYLRRYARAVTGSHDSGDRYIRQFLEVLISDPHVLIAAENTKLQCFVLFHETCRGLGAARDIMAAPDVSGIDRQLASLLPLSRELLLLVHLEGFTITQAAQVVGIADGEASYHLLKARFAFQRLPKFWSTAIAGKIPHFSASSRGDDDDVHTALQPQQSAWQAARQTMSRASWPAGSPQPPHGPHQHDVPPDQSTQTSKRGRIRQREALEVWETEGGAVAPSFVL